MLMIGKYHGGCGSDENHALAPSLTGHGQVARRQGLQDGVLHTWVSHSTNLARTCPIGPGERELR